MRRAAANGQQASGAQAAAALDRLKEAQRRLQQSQSGRAERDVKDAQQQAEELAREQQQIAEAVKGLEANPDRRQEKAQQLIERKSALEEKVGELEKQLDRTAGDLRAGEKEAARKMAEAAGSLRDNKVRDKIRYRARCSGPACRRDDQQPLENSIGSEPRLAQEHPGAGGICTGQAEPGRLDGPGARQGASTRARSGFAGPAAARASAGAQAVNKGSKASSRASKVSRASRASRASKASRVSRASKASRGSKVSRASKGSRVRQASKARGASRAAVTAATLPRDSSRTVGRPTSSTTTVAAPGARGISARSSTRGTSVSSAATHVSSRPTRRSSAGWCRARASIPGCSTKSSAT